MKTTATAQAAVMLALIMTPGAMLFADGGWFFAALATGTLIGGTARWVEDGCPLPTGETDGNG